jgi:hypothetical protein
MLNTISQENTLNRLSGQLSALTRCKKHVAHTSKEAKARIVRQLATKTLIWNPTLKRE